MNWENKFLCPSTINAYFFLHNFMSAANTIRFTLTNHQPTWKQAPPVFCPRKVAALLHTNIMQVWLEIILCGVGVGFGILLFFVVSIIVFYVIQWKRGLVTYTPPDEESMQVFTLWHPFGGEKCQKQTSVKSTLSYFAGCCCKCDDQDAHGIRKTGRRKWISKVSSGKMKTKENKFAHLFSSFPPSHISQFKLIDIRNNIVTRYHPTTAILIVIWVKISHDNWRKLIINRNPQ